MIHAHGAPILSADIADGIAAELVGQAVRIFISVASPDRPKAEEVALALRGDGHVVFLDDHDLPVADTYHERIRSAIEQADIVIFFISPVSVQPKRYTLSELKFVQKKWPHPKGRLIPVMAVPTEMESIPPYLKAVSICFPRGDLAAEVAYEVSRLEKRLNRLWTSATGFTLFSASASGGAGQRSPALIPRLLPIVLLFLAIGAVAGLVNGELSRGWSSELWPMVGVLAQGLVFATLVGFALIYFELGNVRTLAAALLATMIAFVAASEIPEGSEALRSVQGAVRAGVLVFGLCIVLRELVEHWRWAIVTGAGAIGEFVLWDPSVSGLWEMLVSGALCYVLGGVAAARAGGWSGGGAMGRRASPSGRSSSG